MHPACRASIIRRGNRSLLQPSSRAGIVLRIGLAISLVLVFTARISFSQDGIRFSGTLQNDLIALQSTDKALRDQFDFTGTGLLTMNLRATGSPVVRVDGSADLILLSGKSADLLTGRTPVLFAAGATGNPVLFDLRRLYASFFTDVADIMVGRQIVNYGTGLVFSPVDVFTTVDVLDLSLRRRGSDALRVRMPLGDLSGVELASTLSSRSSGVSVAGKAYTNYRGTDYSLIGIYNGQAREGIAGLTAKGDLIAGFKGEIAEHFDPDTGHRYVSVMAGGDYSYANTWFFDAEYLYNQKVEDESDDTVLDIAQKSFGTHNVYGSVRYTINDLMNISIIAIANIERQSALYTAQYFYNILQNANAILFIRYFDMPDAARNLVQNTAELHYGLRLEAAF